MTNKDLEQLLEEYVVAASTHGRATESGDSRKANDAADDVARAYRQIREIGADAQRRLLVLLDNLDPGVRLWAGAHALEFAPERGEHVLSALASQPGFLSLSAQMTLSEWREGSLEFP